MGCRALGATHEELRLASLGSIVLGSLLLLLWFLGAGRPPWRTPTTVLYALLIGGLRGLGQPAATAVPGVGSVFGLPGAPSPWALWVVLARRLGGYGASRRFPVIIECEAEPHAHGHHPGGGAARTLRQETGAAASSLVKTHISWVLLTRRMAYKLKKPVRLPFRRLRQHRGAQAFLRGRTAAQPALRALAVPRRGAGVRRRPGRRASAATAMPIDHRGPHAALSRVRRCLRNLLAARPATARPARRLRAAAAPRCTGRRERGDAAVRRSAPRTGRVGGRRRRWPRCARRPATAGSPTAGRLDAWVRGRRARRCATAWIARQRAARCANATATCTWPTSCWSTAS